MIISWKVTNIDIGGYKTKFERKLDDMARRADPSSLRRGDLFYAMNYNSSSGWTDDDEDYIEQKWWEVLEIQKMNNDYEENRGDITRIFVYVYPVDECGNALTKTQIKKMYPSSADRYLKSIDNNGYATMIEWRLYDDERWSDTPILRVPTSAIEDQDKGYKEIGRSIEYDETPRESNYGRGNAKRLLQLTRTYSENQAILKGRSGTFLFFWRFNDYFNCRSNEIW